MKTNFFRVLRSPESTHKLAEWDPDAMDLEQVLCPVDPSHQRGGRRLTDLNVILPRGTVQDFVWTWQSECLLRDDVLDLFRREGFDGFSVKPVRAKFKKNNLVDPPSLRELVITGWAGLAPKKSGIRRVEYCKSCQYVNYSSLEDARYLIDEAQWDGSDFFMVWPMPKFIFITERVANSICKNRLKGVVLEEVWKLGRIGEDGLGGGRLSYWMSESRAHKLGAAAGIEEI